MNEEKKKHIVIPPPPQSNVYPVVIDPFGSYTGLALGMEMPVQDADDL